LGARAVVIATLKLENFGINDVEIMSGSFLRVGLRERRGGPFPKHTIQIL
jgi:hypothetical protein